MGMLAWMMTHPGMGGGPAAAGTPLTSLDLPPLLPRLTSDLLQSRHVIILLISHGLVVLYDNNVAHLFYMGDSGIFISKFSTYLSFSGFFQLVRVK